MKVLSKCIYEEYTECQINKRNEWVNDLNGIHICMKEKVGVSAESNHEIVSKLLTNEVNNKRKMSKSFVSNKTPTKERKEKPKGIWGEI